MKIDGGRAGAETQGTQRVDQTNVDRTTRGGRKADTGADSVQLSSDAQLATNAAAAASAAPDIRQDQSRRGPEGSRSRAHPAAIPTRWPTN
jgi:hypothetical protein